MPHTSPCASLGTAATEWCQTSETRGRSGVLAGLVPQDCEGEDLTAEVHGCCEITCGSTLCEQDFYIGA